MSVSEREGERVEKIVLGICAMDKKTSSKPMKEIMNRIEKTSIFQIKYISDKVKFEQPVETWPVVHALIAFFSTGFPMEKVEDYIRLRKPFLVNDLEPQKVLWDRRKVYALLQSQDIPVPVHAVMSRDVPDPPTFEEEDDAVIIGGFKISKPFVEKPVDGENHDIYVYYPRSAGGGSKHLFRKTGDESSSFHPEESRVRREGSFIYEQFMNTEGTDVKVYGVGADYAHAEARKSPVVDGKVQRDHVGKEVRFPVILSPSEKDIARKISMAFKQTVCGFDILRADGVSLVCDVNGWSFIKGSKRYWNDAATILKDLILNGVDIPESDRAHLRQACIATQENMPSHFYFPQKPSEQGDEVLCVVGIFRHGDRTPKQKIKMVIESTCQNPISKLVPFFLELSNQASAPRPQEIKIKSSNDLQALLNMIREINEDYDSRQLQAFPPQTPTKHTDSASNSRAADALSDFARLQRRHSLNPLVILSPSVKGEQSARNEEEDVWRDEQERLKIVRTVLEAKGHFSGVNRKVQFQPKLGDDGVVSWLLIVKWGGELTPLGKKQALYLGSDFRTRMYPGDGLLRLHSTFRHDLKIYSSDEGRVQVTSAAFIKAFLNLEGELTPILVSLVRKGRFASEMLDAGQLYREELGRVRSIVKEVILSDHVLTKEQIDAAVPDGDVNMKRALESLGNPLSQMEKLRHNMSEHVASLRSIASAEAVGRGGDSSTAANVQFCRYEFNVCCASTVVHDHIVVVGSLGETKQGTLGLGEWDVYQGIRMRTTETDFPKWTLNILLPVGSEFEYKYVIMRANGSVEWEQCEHNRKISSAEYTSIWIDDGDFGGNTRSIQYNTDDNLTQADPDVMSDDDFDEDEAPSSSSRGLGFCDSPKVRPSPLSLGTEPPASVISQRPSNDESWGQMYRRWNALLKSFYNSKKGTYDISKVTDLADQLKFDLVHNSSLRIIQRVLWSMWLICKPIARYVSSCQYGISPEERVNLATSICGDLLRKIALDLLVSSGKLQIDGMATVHMVDPTRAGERAIQSSSRHVRTRLYFTSESHIVSLMNILRFAPNALNKIGGGIGIVTTQVGLESISQTLEMNYLSSVVIKLSKQQSKSNDDPGKYKIEIMYSPGAHELNDTNRRLAADSPAQPRDRSASQVEARESGFSIKTDSVQKQFDFQSSFPPPALNIGEALISPQKAGSSPSSLSSQFRESLHVASEGQQSPKMTSRPHPMSPSSGFARSSLVSDPHGQSRHIHELITLNAEVTLDDFIAYLNSAGVHTGEKDMDDIVRRNSSSHKAQKK